jgi:hypothetical protein
MPPSSNPLAYNLIGWQGARVPWAFTVANPSDSDPTEPGTPIDVSGWVIMFTVKRFYSDPDSAAVYYRDFTMPAGSVNGLISGEMVDEASELLTPGNYPYDVRAIVPPDTEPQMLMAGQIVIGNTAGTRTVPNFVAWTPPT